MKRLIVMRHAKSSWAEAGQEDIDRPLNARGRRDAPRVGAWLAERQWIPGAALVSAATRTQETWAALGAAFTGLPQAVRDDLYHAAPDAILRALSSAPNVDTVLLLGHQPGIGAFAARLLANPPEDPAFGKYPTAATAIIEVEADDWSAVVWGAARLTAFVTPALLE